MKHIGNCVKRLALILASSVVGASDIEANLITGFKIYIDLDPLYVA